MEILPIADYHCPLPSPFGIPRQSGIVPDLEGRIVFRPEFRSPDALDGIEEFTYLWLIWEFSDRPEAESPTFRPKVRPPRLGGNRSIGVFASRSPFRPNPIGLSSVRLIGIEDKATLIVAGADLMDGTPIFDIKPYIPYCDSHAEAASGFVDKTPWTKLPVIIPESVATVIEQWDKQQGANQSSVDVIRALLAEDPRPKYRKAGERVYGMPFGPFDIRFRCIENSIEVVEIKLISK